MFLHRMKQNSGLFFILFKFIFPTFPWEVTEITEVWPVGRFGEEREMSSKQNTLISFFFFFFTISGKDILDNVLS